MQKVALLILLSFYACKPDSQTSPDAFGPYTLIPASKSVDYADASVVLSKPATDQVPPGDSTLEFIVQNFELGKQTADAQEKNLANSAKGQHVHLILNNDPYKAIYTSQTVQTLPEGEHVILAFLSRSYHESVKTEAAHVLRVLSVGNATPSFEPNNAHLFYSRPKGSYSLADSDQIMLDFYLINTSLSSQGNYIELTVNGHIKNVYKWEPYYIRGLKTGTHTVRLRMLDKNGQLIPGPYNDVERSFSVVE